ncbi:MAG: trypsin-like peptidase domain-containing protein [Acidobacteria bacterium]|nr:trypsin-like peptidase domain-containing protein [Acidobacteriota bacterium]
MSVRIRCPKCKIVFDAPEADAGGLIACTSCGQRMKLPAVAAAAPVPPPADDFAPVRLVKPTAAAAAGKAPVRPAARRGPGLIIGLVTGGVVVVALVGGIIYMGVSGGGSDPAPKPVEKAAPPPEKVEPVPTPPEKVEPTAPTPKPAVGTVTADMDGATLFAKASPAVVRIEMLAADYTPRGQGSGFVVSPDGMVVTNHHVMHRGMRGLVRFGEVKALPMVTVLAQDEEKDLAVIKVDGVDLPYLEVLPEGEKPAVGSRAYAIGTPVGFTNTFSEGSVSGLRDTDRRSEVQTTAPISSGSSGGPLMDARGRVIGVNTWVRVEQQAGRIVESLNFAVSSKEVHEILKKARAAKAKLAVRPAQKPLDAQSMTDIGQAYEMVAAGKWMNAASLADSLRKKNPENVQVLLLKGLVDTRLNFPDEAMKTYETLIRLDPNGAEGHIGLGLTYTKKKMWKEAADALGRAIALSGEDASAQKALGQTLTNLGRKDEALKAFKEAVRLDDQDPEAWMSLGEAYMDQDLFGPAEEAMKSTLRINPHNPMAYAFMGMAAFKAGRINDAMQAAEMALKLQPGLPYAYYVMGLALNRAGRRGEAEQIVENLQKIDATLGGKLLEAIKAGGAAPAEEKKDEPAEKKDPAAEKKDAPAPKKDDSAGKKK